MGTKIVSDERANLVRFAKTLDRMEVIRTTALLLFRFGFDSFDQRRTFTCMSE